MTKSPVQLAQAYLDAMNAGDAAALGADIADEIVIYGQDSSLELRGRPACEARHRDLFASNPDLQVDLLDRIALGEWVVDELIVSGFADGSQRHIVTIFQIADGRIVSLRTLTDQRGGIGTG